MDLIIVESPTKAKTIKKFLKTGYKVESSYGHIRDLPKSKLGIDIKNNFQPEYIIPEKSEKILKKLKDIAKKANKIILASDEDREGEAIAWHLVQALEIDKKKTNRIVFHEITKEAITNALKNPRQIDQNLVNAQQARRILDRLVGYKLSPFLWKKVARGLSAGRVQSVALRLIVEKEREIKAFKIEEYWTIHNVFQKDKQELKSVLNKINQKTISKKQIKSKTEAEKISQELKKENYFVNKINKKETNKEPYAPFTTSTLQQSANRFLGFSAKQTMMIAQQLYEGINIKEGHTGLITYMRTDSLNLSEKFTSEANKYIKEKVGPQYALKKARIFKTKSKGAQEAHEAIRPTKAEREPNSIKKYLNPNQYKLYKLIWQRAIACQMQKAIINTTSIDIISENKKYNFKINGQTIKFDGYLKIYSETSKEVILPNFKEKEKLTLKEVLKEQHFTKPPARYSDASLVKILEQHGIGRPSTYAPTISTIIARNYVLRDENKRLAPTDISFIVIDLLVKHFTKIIDYEFTAEMENNLDDIANGKKKWQPVLKNFYEPFIENLQKKDKELTKKDIMPEEKSQEICDKCGAKMVIKTGRFGKFLACSAYPECKNIKSMHGQDRDKNGEDDEKQIAKLKEKYKNITCDKCGAEMIIKIGKFGPFLACSAYPKCKNIKSIAENENRTGIKCPQCKKGEIIRKKGRRGFFYACDQYPDCKTTFWSKPTNKKCPQCGSLMMEIKNGLKCSNKDCDYTKEK